jgi:diadenosine tetraphosphate (Ap4A) HIT family hydrolase
MPKQQSASAGATCRFCGITEEEITHAHTLAFATRDSFPLTPGHSLIIPRRHIASFFEATPEERVAMMELLDRAKAVLDREHAPDGYNIGINDGQAAGQTIMHVHLHLIPRYLSDTADTRGGIRWILPERAAYWKR